MEPATETDTCVRNTTNITLSPTGKFRENRYLYTKHNQISTYFWNWVWLRHRTGHKYCSGSVSECNWVF